MLHLWSTKVYNLEKLQNFYARRFKSVNVNILVDNEVAKYVASESSQFWIKTNNISYKISGLSTLISGYKIELSPKYKTPQEYDNGKYKYVFDGLDSQPNDQYNNEGYYISLIANDKDNAEVGTPVFYNNFQIGEIIAKEFVLKKYILQLIFMINLTIW